jgi:hypothetical protein
VYERTPSSTEEDLTAPARKLRVVRTDKWHFSIQNDRASVSGPLPDTDVVSDPENAQAELVALVVRWTGLRYQVDWKRTSENEWTAELMPLASESTD